MTGIRRRAARAVVLDPAGRILLFRGHDPARPHQSIWHTPGGGIEPGEDDRHAARRELAEETGLDAEPGPLVWERSVQFSFDGVAYDQDEVFFLVQVDGSFEPDTSRHNRLEQQYMTGHGWFDADDLERCEDLIAPADLPERVAELVRSGPPDRPVRVRGAVLP